jgi:DNA-binding transcriptional MerR regulator
MNEIIKNLLDDGFDLAQIKDALSDGRYLSTQELTQKQVEEAHSVVEFMMGENK